MKTKPERTIFWIILVAILLGGVAMHLDVEARPIDSASAFEEYRQLQQKAFVRGVAEVLAAAYQFAPDGTSVEIFCKGAVLEPGTGIFSVSADDLRAKGFPLDEFIMAKGIKAAEECGYYNSM